MYGREDDKKSGNVGSEHDSVRQKVVIIKTLKLRQTTGMVNRVRLVKLNEG